MIHNINYQKSHFLLSVTNINHLPNDNLIEIAVIGKSNTGKSSTINTLVNKKIANTSKKPGCTKSINLFQISLKIRLIDFPGYGHSTTSKKTKKKQEVNLIQYLKTRENLKGLILTTDIRHPKNWITKKLAQTINQINIPILVLLNKSDKISKYKSYTKLQQIQKIIPLNNANFITFSSRTLQGSKNLRKTINDWYNITKQKNIKY